MRPLGLKGPRHDEVRILIFDDPAELEKRQRPVMVRSGRGPFRPARPRRARAMHEIFFENLRNPARIRLADLMRQFCPSQLDSTPGNLAFRALHPTLRSYCHLAKIILYFKFL